MGRHITGDIERKLWFGVQPSDSADQFGCIGTQPYSISYSFDEDHINKIKERLNYLKNRLTKDYRERMQKFFQEVNGYNDDIIKKHGFDAKEFNEKLRDYTDIELGEEILKCVIETGSCEFEAEI